MTRARSPIVAVREWIVRLWGTIGSGRRDADMEEELRAHLELAAEDAGRRTPDVAARAARRSATGPRRRPWTPCAINEACPGSTT